MKAKIELATIEDVQNFVGIVKDIKADVRLIGKDENGADWDISAKSLLASLVLCQRGQLHREHTAHEVDWGSLWCVCEEDIYTAISDFVVYQY